MNKFVNILKVGGIVVAVVAVGILLGWLAGHNHQAPTPAAGTDTTRSRGADAAASASSSNSAPKRLVRHGSMDGSAQAAAPNPNLITNWEDRVDQILTTQDPESEKAKKMLELFPNLPEEGQLEVAQHLSNLVADEDYASLSRFLTDHSLSESVLDVLFGDVLNRPNSLKLPTLLEVARDPDNAKASEAHDILELFLEEDYGTDWNIWQVKVEQWLKDNPD